ncbi:hypothetical protein P170DRAFT_184404 [Aspergillus steynii IBT 23096]|uniref:Uncharacterized protein n=1 Tax=Aspergillus steynii IBT 23096 TaxID=1392250 RepID=A0A2I2G982_9EURO|nr:uncharacterized protein P170DRAFT_184404 [Aspergillus steynii IBT 23096]PLB49445.1 hypothetical protein P170DRAFT_184404 [Aspergillus steynii IBT 23096]
MGWVGATSDSKEQGNAGTRRWISIHEAVADPSCPFMHSNGKLKMVWRQRRFRVILGGLGNVTTFLPPQQDYIMPRARRREGQRRKKKKKKKKNISKLQPLHFKLHRETGNGNHWMDLLKKPKSKEPVGMTEAGTPFHFLLGGDFFRFLFWFLWVLELLVTT